MKEVTTFFLKIAVIFIGIPVLALCIFLVPHWHFAAYDCIQILLH